MKELVGKWASETLIVTSSSGVTIEWRIMTQQFHELKRRIMSWNIYYTIPMLYKQYDLFVKSTLKRHLTTFFYPYSSHFFTYFNIIESTTGHKIDIQFHFFLQDTLCHSFSQKYKSKVTTIIVQKYTWV